MLLHATKHTNGTSPGPVRKTGRGDLCSQHGFNSTVSRGRALPDAGVARHGDSTKQEALGSSLLHVRKLASSVRAQCQLHGRIPRGDGRGSSVAFLSFGRVGEVPKGYLPLSLACRGRPSALRGGGQRTDAVLEQQTSPTSEPRDKRCYHNKVPESLVGWARRTRSVHSLKAYGASRWVPSNQHRVRV